MDASVRGSMREGDLLAALTGYRGKETVNVLPAPS